MGEDIRYWCETASAALAVLGYVPYIVATIRKETVPSKGSWLIWSAFDTIAAISMLIKGTPNYQIITVAAGNWITLGFALWYGKAGWTTLEKFCVALAGIGVVAGFIVQDPVITLVITLSAVFIGSFPTFESGVCTPYKEDRWAWLLFAASSALAAISVKEWTVAHAAQPIVFLCVSGPMTLMTWRPFARPQAEPPLEPTE